MNSCAIAAAGGGSGAPTSALLRLAASGGRTDRLRIALTAGGSALTTIMALTALSVMFISNDAAYRLDVLD